MRQWKNIRNRHRPVTYRRSLSGSHHNLPSGHRVVKALDALPYSTRKPATFKVLT